MPGFIGYLTRSPAPHPDVTGRTIFMEIGMSEQERAEQELAGLVSYSVKFVCGIQDADELKVGMVRPGIYATEINIHNYNNTEVRVRKLVLPLVIGGEPQGREPRFVGVANQDNISLPPDTATMDDSFRIGELVYGSPPPEPLPLTIGYLEIVSTQPLAVDAVYTVSDRERRSIAIDVNRIEGRQK